MLLVRYFSRANATKSISVPASMAASRTLSVGRTLATRPAASASVALMESPVRIIFMAYTDIVSADFLMFN